MQNRLKVISSIIKADDKFQQYVECTMADFSVWTCDIEGNNWQKIKPSDEELSQKFYEHQEQAYQDSGKAEADEKLSSKKAPQAHDGNGAT